MKQTTSRSIINITTSWGFVWMDHTFRWKPLDLQSLILAHCKDPGWNQSYLWAIGIPTTLMVQKSGYCNQLRWRIYYDLRGVLYKSQSRVVVWDFFHQYRGVSKNSGFSPQIIHFNRIFHCFHHPLGGFPPIFGNTQIWIHKDFGRMTSDFQPLVFFVFVPKLHLKISSRILPSI